MSILTFMVAPPIGSDAAVGARVTRHVVGRRTVLTVYGEIDADSLPALEHAVETVLAAGAVEVWIDFSPTEFMESGRPTCGRADGAAHAPAQSAPCDHLPSRASAAAVPADARVGAPGLRRQGRGTSGRVSRSAPCARPPWP